MEEIYHKVTGCPTVSVDNNTLGKLGKKDILSEICSLLRKNPIYWYMQVHN